MAKKKNKCTSKYKYLQRNPENNNYLFSHSFEGNEVFWVGLIIMKDNEHGGLLLVVYQTVEAVGRVRTSRRRGYHGGITDCITACKDTSNIHPLQPWWIRWRKPVSWVICIDRKVHSSSKCSSCNRKKELFSSIENFRTSSYCGKMLITFYKIVLKLYVQWTVLLY